MSLQNKDALRKTLLERRSRWPQGRGAVELARQAHVLGPVAGRVVSGYWPCRHEIDPRPLMKALAAAGAVIALPRALLPARSALLEFRVWKEGDPLFASRFGVEEPGEAAAVAEPDLLLVPLLGFDGSGGRLGYGAGYYDRTLRALRAGGKGRAIGLAFSGQEVDEVPMNDFDERLDEALTETGHRIFRARL